MKRILETKTGILEKTIFFTLYSHKYSPVITCFSFLTYLFKCSWISMIQKWFQNILLMRMMACMCFSHNITKLTKFIVWLLWTWVKLGVNLSLELSKSDSIDAKYQNLLTQKMRKLKPKNLVLIRECLLQMNSFVQFQDSEWIAIILW